MPSCGVDPDSGPTAPPRRADRRRPRQWVGRPYPLGATYDGTGTNFSLFSSVAEGVELCLLDPRRRRGAHRADRGRRLLLAHLPARRPPGPALRLPGPRPVGPGAGAVVQPGQAAARPVRQGDRRRGRLGPGLLRLRLRRPRSAQHRRQRAARAPRRRQRPVLRLGQRPPAGDAMHETIIYEAHVRGLTIRHPAVPEELRGTYAGIAHPAVIEHLTVARHHRHRADAGAPVRPRPPPRRARPAQLLGLQLHRLPRPAQRLLGRTASGSDPGPGAGVQDDGQGAHHAGHRGDPRRRLQPHRRGQPHGPDAVDAGHRQPRLLPPRRRRPRATTSTSPAPATASTCATRTCCS